MKDHYLCSVCAKSFPIHEAKDGFKAGFKEGFLCPYCGTNLVEVGESDDLFNLDYSFSFIALICVLTWLVSEEIIAIQLIQHSLVNGLLNLVLVLSVPVVMFTYLNRDAFFKPRVVYTRKARKLRAKVE